MAPDLEKGEGAGTGNNTANAVLDEKKKPDVDPQQQDASEVSSKEQKQGDQANNGLAKQTSKTEAESRTLQKVPRSQRRGLFASLAIIPEVTNPHNYGNVTKWWMTIIVSFAAITSSTGSSIFYRRYSQKLAKTEQKRKLRKEKGGGGGEIKKKAYIVVRNLWTNVNEIAALAEVAVDLKTTPTVTNLSLAFYMLAMAFTPLWW